jgi:biofilm PGA synthesis protein PgaA
MQWKIKVLARLCNVKVARAAWGQTNQDKRFRSCVKKGCFLSVRPLRCAIMAALALAGLAAPALAQEWAAAHGRAIAQFRSGDVSAALPALQALQAQFPEELTLRADLIVVARAAGQDAIALAVGRITNLTRLPAYALAPLGRAARTQGDFALSEGAYAEYLRRSLSDTGANTEANTDATIGRALALRGLGKLQEALDLVDALPRQSAPQTQRAILEVKALVSASFGKDLEVVRWSLEMLALDPNDAAAQRLRFDALTRLGLSEQAREATPTALLSREEQAQIAHEQLIAESRFVPVDETIQGYRFRVDPIIESLAALEAQFPDTRAAERAKWDRVSLLLDRQRFAEARAVLQVVFATRAEFPAWFTAVSAQTLLANREAALSVEWFQKAFAAGITDLSTRSTFFYALLEAEWAAEALAHSQTLLTDAARTGGDKSERLRVQILRTRALLYTDQVDAAWKEITALVALAPANTEVNLVKAEAEATRGWARTAVDTVSGVRGQFPNNLSATVQLADSLLQRGDRVASRAWLEEAQTFDPENRRALRSARDRAISDAGLARLDVSVGASGQGASLANASREQRVELSAYSPWLFDRARVFGSAQQLRDTRNAQDVIERNVGALGVEWSALDWSATAQAIGDNDDRFGGSVQIAHTISDQLRVSGQLSYDDRDTPLRAWRAGTHVTHAQLGAQWRAHESQAIGASLGAAHFTDGNNRADINVYWTQRWLSQAHWRIDTRVDAYAARNSKNDVPYFAPALRYGAAAAGVVEWVQWRHYEKSLTHRLNATVGFDAQRDVATTGLYALRYEHAWRLGRCTELRYGVEWTQRGYDGKSENKRAGFLTLEQRLAF